ncbi:MAG: YaiI/YqxD family protein [Planctomycetota bacterium]
MHIWVDADACPADAKEVLYKTSRRLQIKITLVANQMMFVPKSNLIHFELVGAGANVADQRIVELLSAGDLVISADIPLAAAAVAKGATVLDPRGHVLDAENVGSRLAARNLMDDLRGSGLETGGPPAYSAKNKQDFANQLDRLLTKLLRQASKPKPS